MVLYLHTGRELKIKTKPNGGRGGEQRSARTPASVPAVPQEAWGAGLACCGEPPSFPSTSLGQEPPQTQGSPSLYQVESTGCFYPEEERKWGSGWQIIFPLVFLPCYSARFSFPATKILSILLLAQHSGSSHNDLYFNTKIKSCVP